MAKGTVLFERNPDYLESDTGESTSATDSEFTWYDESLIGDFDEATRVAKRKIADRMILHGEQPLKNGIDVPKFLDCDGQPETCRKSKKKSKKRKMQTVDTTDFVHHRDEDNVDGDTSKLWEVGAPCRAIFSEDGCEYEAIIQSVNQKNGTCVIKYIGYDNEEEVPWGALQQSQGATARQYQIQQALEDLDSDKETEEEGEHCDPFEDVVSNGASWIGQSEFYNSRQDPFQRQPFVHPQNRMTVPIPPPPPPHLTSQFPEEDSEALSAMLLSWYMSGFHTGYYQGLRDAKKGKLSHPRMHSKKK